MKLQRHHYLISALILGAICGILAHNLGDNSTISFIQEHILQPIGQLFLRLVFMIVVPMVFCGLFLGVYQLSVGQHSKSNLGKVARKTLLFTLMTSTASVIIGISLVTLFQPGKGLILPEEFINLQKSNEQVQKIANNASQSKSFSQAIIEIVPKNPIEAATKALDGEMISLMFFALILGIAFCQVYPKNSLAEAENNQPIFIELLEQIYNASMRVMEYAMKISPLAVFALIFGSTLKFGSGLLVSLLYYVGVVLIGLLIQQFIVYGTLLKIFTKASPLKFFNHCKEVYLYAFATASSNATLPKSLEVAEKKLHLTPSISRFVLTVGSTANQNGTALFEGITVLFLAQVFSIDLSLTQQIQVVIMSIIAGIGTAGVPGGSLPLIVILLHQVGIPVEGIGLVLGVDRLLDMCRTTINVSGDLVIAKLVDHHK